MSYELSLNKYGEHRFSLQPNEDDVLVSKCQKCKLAKAWLMLFDKTHCEALN